ncbi:cytochrome P450 [Fomes fomentarius]|nr:cytochrome P450 [Fomes fomentarius]
MASFRSVTVSVALCGLIFLLVRLFWSLTMPSRLRGLRLPPGPRPLPLFGNIFAIPRVRPWLVYGQLQKKYGYIMLFQAMGQRLVIISNLETALELLEKRSAIYSSRPRLVLYDLCGWGSWALPVMPYGQRWRILRRTFWQHFRPAVINKWNVPLENGARGLLICLLDSPESLIESIRFSLGTALVTMTYGTLQSRDETQKIIAELDEAMSSLELFAGGAHLLEFFPILARIPLWLPGTAFLRRIAGYPGILAAIRERHWANAKAAVCRGNATSSMAAAMIEDISRLEGDKAAAHEEACKSTIAVTYTAGIDTSLASLSAFFVAMSLYPAVQKKAQAELDAIVGPQRLPQHADRELLPYVGAIVKEVLRWHVGGPLGMPHLSTSDGEYDGYLIPKDSILLVNVWSISRDPKRYPDPEKFIPERYLKDNMLNPDAVDPGIFAFGFGPRICPARHFADAALFIYIASVLHTLDISPPLDDSGHPIRIEPRGTTGLISYMEDCRCTVKPRSSSATALIHGWQASNLYETGDEVSTPSKA